ncbi:putative membrane-anchored protein [Streptomyces sp. SPB4]|nr:putative membrane-anchored protein [Streptomyces sp. SPB4]
MTYETRPATGSRAPAAPPRNKVPEITAYFWVIKVLCTTVGEPRRTTSTPGWGWD